MGQHLADGVGFVGIDGQVTARRAPLYPLLLSVVYRATGPNESAARLLQVLMGALLVFPVFRLGRRYFGETAGLVAAALVALNPFLAFVSGYALSENLYLLLVFGALVAMPRPADLTGPRWRPLLAAGLYALAALTRPTAMALGILCFAAAALLAPGPGGLRLRRLGMAAALFLVLTVPWMIRNAASMGGWVGMTSYSGMILLQGNNHKVIDIPHYRGGVAPLASLPRYNELARMDELERDAFAGQMARQFLRHNWRAIPKMAWWKLQRFWRLQSDTGLSGIRSGWWFSSRSFLGGLASRFDVGFLYSVVVFPLFIAGVVVSRRRWRELVFLYGPPVLHTGLAIVFFGSIRMRVPVEPVMAVFAATALVALSSWIRRRRSGTHAPGPAPGSA
jgi:4-amino-4-deoxy-L-arabinose transferase-like glycosyltransferase